jgi:hypothetical protein
LTGRGKLKFELQTTARRQLLQDALDAEMPARFFRDLLTRGHRVVQKYRDDTVAAGPIAIGPSACSRLVSMNCSACLHRHQRYFSTPLVPGSGVWRAGGCALGMVLLLLLPLAVQAGDLPTSPTTFLRIPSPPPPRTGIHLPDESGTMPLREQLADEPSSPPSSREPSPEANTSRLVLPDTFPPLSLSDCNDVLLWLNARLSRPPAETEDPHEEILTVLEQIKQYVRIMDNRSSTLAYYRWVFVDRSKVATQGLDEDIFESGRVIADVSAISLEAELGDVFVHWVEVTDSRGEKTEFRLGTPARLRAGLPRREVFHLYFPTDIRRVRVCYESAPPVRIQPRVTLHAGITKRTEYLKGALYYLNRARQALLAGQREECATQLDRAARRIQRFGENR